MSWVRVPPGAVLKYLLFWVSLNCLIYSYFVATPPDPYIRKHFVLLFTEKVCPERASLVDDSQLPASEKTMDVDADASVSSKSP